MPYREKISKDDIIEIAWKDASTGDYYILVESPDNSGNIQPTLLKLPADTENINKARRKYQDKIDDYKDAIDAYKAKFPGKSTVNATTSTSNEYNSPEALAVRETKQKLADVSSEYSIDDQGMWGFGPETLGDEYTFLLLIGYDYVYCYLNIQGNAIVDAQGNILYTKS